MTYEDFANEIGVQYSVFQYALTGIYLGMTGANLQVSAQSLRDYRVRARYAVGAFFAQMNSTIDEFGDGVNQDALDSRRPQFVAQARRIVTENISSVEKRLLVGKTSFSSMLTSVAHGGIGMLLQKREQYIDFKSSDAAGRKWQSLTLLKSSARDFAYQTIIDTQIAQLKSEGSILAKVMYPNPDHRHQDTILSIEKEIDGHPTIEAVRSALFHPNATAEIFHV